MLTTKHPFYPKFVEIMKIAASNVPVYDLGTSGRFVKEMGMVESLFDSDRYCAGGYMPDNIGKRGGCDFHCDLENIDNVQDGVVGSVIALSVLEHVRYPERALLEIRRILREGGVFIASVPFLWPYHGKSERETSNDISLNDISGACQTHATYPDYWRFTHEGLIRVITDAGFSRLSIYPMDGRIICRLQMFDLYKYIECVPGLFGLIEKLDRPRLGRLTTMHWVLAYK